MHTRGRALRPVSGAAQARARAPGRALSLRGCSRHSVALDADSSGSRAVFGVAAGLFPLPVWFLLATAVWGLFSKRNVGRGRGSAACVRVTPYPLC